jgi:uncharacterized protein (DUF2236 family)
VGLAPPPLPATATGLAARLAPAYASGVAEEPEDDGFFGPASVTWQVIADLATPIAGLRALLMQALHPLVRGCLSYGTGTGLS